MKPGSLTFEFELPAGIPIPEPQRDTPEQNDSWQLENLRRRQLRGDCELGQSPVEVAFSIEDNAQEN